MIKSLEQLNTALKSTGLPVAYDHFPEDTPIPVIVYHETGTRNMAADNRVYCPITDIEAILVTPKKNRSLERAVENVLDEGNLVWDKSEAFLDDEKCYQVTYQFEL